MATSFGLRPGSTWESIRWELGNRANLLALVRLRRYSCEQFRYPRQSCGVAATALRNLESKRDSKLFGVLLASDALAARLGGIVKPWVLVALTVCTLPVTSWHLSAAVGVDERVLSRPETREIDVEADPEHEQACFSMGRVTIDYASGETGLPKVGFRIIDPRGREIGYDPRTNRGWQQMPLAQAFLDCEENEDTGELRNCKGHIEICGPMSGTYQIVLSSAHGSKYSISVSASSQRKRDGSGYEMTGSRADLKGDIRGQEAAVVMLQYSREAGTSITLTGSENRHLTDRSNNHDRDASH